MANERILIIDDDEDLVLAMRLPLQAAGFHIERAADADEGLRKVKEINPHLIILDMMMDTPTAGLRVCSTLRNPEPQSEYAAFRQIPILMLTAMRAATSLRLDSQEYARVDAFIEKPIQPDALVAQVQRLLR